MISTVELNSFRGFRRLLVDLLPGAYIIGPNSAGKSTILEAIELATRCIRLARRKSPSEAFRDRGERIRGFSLSNSGFSETDPVRFDFGSEEARVRVTWSNGAAVNIVWPEEAADQAAFFYFEDKISRAISTPSAIRSYFSTVTVFPVITPLDHIEPLKDEKYIEQQIDTRLASRHFRNHAYRMMRAGKWQDFTTFSREWLPEVELLDVTFSVEANRLAVFYMEAGSRVPKELAWAGDGMQIWIQLLWHFFRAKEVGTLVLDEPDVYLHPELQRRLVRLLESRPRQVILASHSAEILAEAPNDSVVWVDRRSIGARRTKTNQALSTLSSLLGSKFNLSIARGMRSKAVIATDFRDSRVFAALARTVGGERLASDAHVTHIALGDAIRRMNPAHLATNLREILPAGVKAFVILQRGYRSKTEINEICKEVSIPGVRLFVLARNELENYLLDADAIARVSGADVQSAAVKLAETLYSLRGRTRAHYVAARINSMPEGSNAPAIASATDAEFESSWNHSDFPVALTEGSIAIELLSQSLQRDGYRGIATTQLAKSLRPEGMAVDLFRTLIDISEMLN